MVLSKTRYPLKKTLPKGPLPRVLQAQGKRNGEEEPLTGLEHQQCFLTSHQMLPKLDLLLYGP